MNELMYLRNIKFRVLIAFCLSCVFLLGHAAETDAHECLIEPMVIAKVGSPVQGVIDRLLVDRSEMVSAGQPIAVLKATVERANLEQAEARAAMQGEITARQADLNLAQLNRARMKKLYTKKMVSAQQRDEGIAQLHVARAALRQAQDNLLVLQHDLARSQVLLLQRTIRSPINGAVVERHTFPGEFVYDNPIMTIAQLDPLRIEVVLPATLFGQFQPGDIAVVYPEIDSAEPIHAKVDVVDRLLDTFSGTFGVRLTLPNPGLAITAGQKCQLEFISSGTEIATGVE